MCECLSYADGSRHLCAACAPDYDDLETLRSRCARLRAALAGVVLKEGPEASIESFDVALATLRQVDDADVTTPWTIKLSHLIAALEVLRETAEEGKT